MPPARPGRQQVAVGQMHLEGEVGETAVLKQPPGLGPRECLGPRAFQIAPICCPGFAPTARSRWERRLRAGTWAKPTYASIVLLPRICADSSIALGAPASSRRLMRGLRPRAG